MVTQLCCACIVQECVIFIPIPYRSSSSLMQIAMETQTVKSLTPFSIEAILTRDTPVGADPGKYDYEWEKADNQRVPGTSPGTSPVHVSPSPIDMTLRQHDMSVTSTRDEKRHESRSRSALSDRYNDGSPPDAFSESSYSDEFDSDAEDDEDCRDYADDVEEGTFLDLTCRETMTPGHGDGNIKNLQCLSPHKNTASTSTKGTSCFTSQQNSMSASAKGPCKYKKNPKIQNKFGCN